MQYININIIYVNICYIYIAIVLDHLLASLGRKLSERSLLKSWKTAIKQSLDEMEQKSNLMDTSPKRNRNKRKLPNTLSV